MTADELLENFSYLTDWEDKYRYLIELGDSLPPFPDTDKTEEHKVEGCQSQVWFTVQKEDDKYYFNATSDAHIVRGLEAVLLTLVNGKTAPEIQTLDLMAAFTQLGLEEHLSPTRRNGFFAMINRIKESVA
ncbi:MAG: SufE family protein [Alphaproteobacteria bacterium]|nr:SufE family protein [Alphaproteobacteria bacterium]